MKKRIIFGVIAVIAAIGLVFAFSACKITLTLEELQEFAATGTVVDASSGDGVADAKVTLTYVEGSAVETDDLAKEEEEESTEEEKEPPEDVDNYQEDNTTYTATTDSDGVFTFDAAVQDIIEGEYEITVERDGFVFVPPGNITILGGTQDLGTYMAFPYDKDTEEYYVKMILVWSPNFSDVDGHLTYPKDGQSVTAATGSGTFYPYTPPDAADVDTGFSPEMPGIDSALGSLDSYREVIYWDNLESTLDVTGGSAPRISLDVDNRGRDTEPAGGPETMTIRQVPFDDVATTKFNREDAGYGSGYDSTISWNGVMEYYVRAYAHTTDSDGNPESGVVAESYLAEVASGESAEAKMYVFQGDTILGAYTLPKFTDIKNASLLRIHCFKDSGGEWFQLWPHTTLVPDWEYNDPDNDDTNEYRFKGIGMDSNGVISTKKVAR